MSVFHRPAEWRTWALTPNTTAIGVHPMITPERNKFCFPRSWQNRGYMSGAIPSPGYLNPRLTQTDFRQKVQGTRQKKRALISRSSRPYALRLVPWPIIHHSPARQSKPLRRDVGSLVSRNFLINLRSLARRFCGEFDLAFKLFNFFSWKEV